MRVSTLLKSNVFLRFCLLEYGVEPDELSSCSFEFIQEMFSAWCQVPSCLRGLAPSERFRSAELVR